MSVFSSAIFDKNYVRTALLYVVLFLIYLFSEPDELHYSSAIFFAMYVTVGVISSEILLPRFFYTKKYFLFVMAIILMLIAMILVEEFVLEKIFFPDSRGRKFFGILSSFLELSPFVVIPVGFRLMQDMMEKQKQMEELQKAIHESELQFLKNQINPHFLFNNLNNLYAHAIEDSKKTPEIILKLSDILRYTLYDCRVDYVPLNREIEHIKAFIDLNQLQIQERGEVHTNIQELQTNLVIPPHILNVFIENAFKHSTSGLSSGLYIDISLQMNDNQLAFRCVNNFAEQTNTENLDHGIGLDNVKNRLELLCPNQYNLDIRTEDQWFIVELKLDLNHDKKHHS